jgi:hypothetical protein
LLVNLAKELNRHDSGLTDGPPDRKQGEKVRTHLTRTDRAFPLSPRSVKS